MKINLKSIFISGVVAGLVILIIGGGLVPIIGDQMDEVLKNRLLPPLSKGAMIFFAINSIIMGIGVVGLYSLIKTVTKSKLRAILTSSILFWFFVYFLSNTAKVAFGFIPIGITIIGTAWGLLELLAATVVGAMLYRDENISSGLTKNE